MTTSNGMPFQEETEKKEPFDEESEVPNELTRLVMEQVERGEGLFHAKDIDDLFRQLGI